MSKFIALSQEGNDVYINESDILVVGGVIEKGARLLNKTALVIKGLGQMNVDGDPREVAAKLNGEDYPPPPRLVQ